MKTSTAEMIDISLLPDSLKKGREKTDSGRTGRGEK